MSKFDIMRASVRVVQAGWRAAASVMVTEIGSDVTGAVDAALDGVVSAIYAKERAEIERELYAEEAAIQDIEEDIAKTDRPHIGGMVFNASLNGGRFSVTSPTGSFWTEDEP